MRGNVQVVVALVIHLLVFCTHLLHPCDSKHIRNSSLTQHHRYSTEMHKLPVLKPNETSKPLISPEMLSANRENSRLGHHRLTRPSGTSSQQLIVQPQWKSETTTKPFGSASSRLSLVKGNYRLMMKHNLRTISAIKSMIHRLRLRQSRKNRKGQAFTIRPISTAVEPRLPARATRVPLNKGKTKGSDIRMSRQDPPPIKPDNGTDMALPLTLNDILMMRKHKGNCTKRRFMDKIHHEDCNPVYFENSLCFGLCPSYFVPREFKSCSSCIASSVEVIEVQLKCPGKIPAVITKKVDIVKSCRCRATSCNLP